MGSLVEIVGWANGGLAARLFRGRFNGHHPDAMTFVDIQLNPANLPPLSSSNDVEKYGETLHQALNNHPAICGELQQILANHANPGSLRLWIDRGASLRWEALFQSPPSSFLALQQHCAVSRLAYLNAPPGNARVVGKTLRMAAFLSPARSSAAMELAALIEEIQKAIAAGLRIECAIYLGEQELLDATQARVNAGQLPGITVFSIPHDTIAFDQCLRQRPVELLHFFCHGISGAGVQALEFATINDWDNGASNGSVVMSIERLNEILELASTTWITVLNACEGAQPAPQTDSMALKLARRGSPMVVGMAEPIKDVDAPIFSRAFYEALFDRLNRQLTNTPAGTPVRLHLARAVTESRRVVQQAHQLHPANGSRWLLPLLYERGGPLTVLVSPGAGGPTQPPGGGGRTQPPGDGGPTVPHVPTADEETKIRIDAIAGALRSLPAGTPDQVRDEIMALFDKAPVVPASLRPDRWGAFVR